MARKDICNSPEKKINKFLRFNFSVLQISFQVQVYEIPKSIKIQSVTISNFFNTIKKRNRNMSSKKYIYRFINRWTTCASNMAGLFLNHSRLKGSISQLKVCLKNLVHFTTSPQYPVIMLSLVLSIICFVIFICWAYSFDPVVWECALDSREGNLFKRKRSRRISKSLKTAPRIFWHFGVVWRKHSPAFIEGFTPDFSIHRKV